MYQSFDLCDKGRSNYSTKRRYHQPFVDISLQLLRRVAIKKSTLKTLIGGMSLVFHCHSDYCHIHHATSFYAKP